MVQGLSHQDFLEFIRRLCQLLDPAAAAKKKTQAQQWIHDHCGHCGHCGVVPFSEHNEIRWMAFLGNVMYFFPKNIPITMTSSFIDTTVLAELLLSMLKKKQSPEHVALAIGALLNLLVAMGVRTIRRG